MTKDAIDALAAVVPYAESRAEDLSEQVDAGIDARALPSEIQDATAARDRACKAVEDAKAVLRAAGRRC